MPEDQNRTAPKVRRTSIRNKLLVALALPVLVVALITAFQANHAQNELSSTKDEASLGLAAGGPSTFVTALLDERNLTALHLLGLDSIKLSRVSTIPAARKATDNAESKFRSSIANNTSQVRALYGPAIRSAEATLTSVRKSADAYTGPRNTQSEAGSIAKSTYDKYSKVIAKFTAANDATVSRIDDAELRNRADAIAAQTYTADLTSRMLREAALPALGVGQANWLTMADLLSRYRVTSERAIQDLRGDHTARKVIDAYYGRASTHKFTTLIAGFIDARTIAPDELAPLIQVASDPTHHPNDTDAWKAARTSLQSRADSLVSDARTSRNIYVAVFVIATLASLVLALLIARSIARPLISIAHQADDMATRALPEAVGSILATPIGQDIDEPDLEPISVRSRDEVADVAASINVVQQRALDLAVEQAVQRRNFADTFLNLGRRVQGLVARQLDFITELEDTETDSETLADLFKLDHLATRIRRNAESLVVLAGVTRKRRAGEPAPLIDALRSALGEVDDYPRVAIGDVAAARLPTSVAADLSHILAELIENGLNFSPPDTDVEVAGRRVPNGYEITVQDHGIGMNADQVATANRRLSGNESFTVAPSRYMGHYVAGHLATGLGIEVKLTSDSHGTTATVMLANSLLVTKSAPPDRGSEPVPSGPRGESTGPAPTADESTFRPAAPPPAPQAAQQLSSLLTAHRRLSHPGGAPGADRSPWAKRMDLDPDGDSPGDGNAPESPDRANRGSDSDPEAQPES